MSTAAKYSQFTVRIGGPIREASRLQEIVSEAIETALTTETKKLRVEVEVLLVQQK